MHTSFIFHFFHAKLPLLSERVVMVEAKEPTRFFWLEAFRTSLAVEF
jgi:hypothetical protein